MGKKIIRLTEQDLHNIVKEAVEQIIEGQGWNFFKTNAKKAMNGDFDGDNPMDDKNYREDKKKFIKNGSLGTSQKYYDDEGEASYDKSNKRINKGLSGKLGRKAGVFGTETAIRARNAYNKLKGK